MLHITPRYFKKKIDELIILLSFSWLFATNGYVKFPFGFIIQWGNGGSAGTSTIYFPLVFPNACFNAVACSVYHGSGSYGTCNTFNKSYVRGYSNTGGLRYISVGW